MTTLRLSLGPAFLGLALAACATTQTQPPGAPPSPSSVTLEEPGGDAADPQEAALKRQLELPWGWATDKDEQLRVPMVDQNNMKRVRYWVLDHFTGFRYGSDFYVMNVVLIQDVPKGEEMDSRTCLQRAEKWGHPQLRSWEVKFSDIQTSTTHWRNLPIVVKSVDGYVDIGFERRKFSAAYAAYPAYPDACLVFAMGVPWEKHEDLAKAVRDRWVKEGVPRMVPLTPTRPFRKED